MSLPESDPWNEACDEHRLCKMTIAELEADNAALRAERDNALTAHDLCKGAADRYKADNAALREQLKTALALSYANIDERHAQRDDNAARSGCYYHCPTCNQPQPFTQIIAAIDAAIAKDKP